MQTPSGDSGALGSGILVALLILAALAIGAFFFLGGDADVEINAPTVEVSSSPAN